MRASTRLGSQDADGRLETAEGSRSAYEVCTGLTCCITRNGNGYPVTKYVNASVKFARYDAQAFAAGTTKGSFSVEAKF